MRDSGLPAPATIDEYLERIPEPARTTLAKMRRLIRSVVPAETAEAISYGMPAFHYRGALVGFAAHKDHCGFYPMNPAVIIEFKDQLQGYATAKGTIRFPVDKPLPDALLKKIVKARVAENRSKKKR